MILVTGGAGFIGANFVLEWCAGHDEPVVNLDKLTYAGNLGSLAPLADNPRHVFVRGDIGDRSLVLRLLAAHRPRAIVHFAAESHVDRSIDGPAEFVETNVVGTFALLDAARAYWSALPEPSAPRSASCTCRPTRSTDRSARRSRVQRDDAVRAEQPVLRVEGRRGPPRARLPPHLRPADAHDQLLEQLRPAAVPREADPADDRQRARRQAAAGLRRRHERPRLALRRRPLRGTARRPRARAAPARPTTSAATPRSGTSRSCAPSAACWRSSSPARDFARLISFVKDRPGHDRRYAIDATKIRRDLGWTPRETFETGLRRTVRWYLDHGDWLAAVTSGDYQKWVTQNYGAVAQPA